MDFKDDDDNLINVNGCDDPYYRYKMPRLHVEHISKQGGNTVITNAQVVSVSIYRELRDLKSYFSKTLGAKVSAGVLDGSLVLRGTKSAKDLQALLQKYISKDVLCQSCGNPETVRQPSKRPCRKCQACGVVQTKTPI
jgi:translation initiation factor 5